MMLDYFSQFTNNHPLFANLFTFLILCGLALGISFLFDMKDIGIILLFYCLITIFLYAYGVLDFFFASTGFILFSVLAYFIFKEKRGIET
ncbi:MAG: hypothetical protein GF329_14180 [Candidatus Lokiarchaeota archaeon]|nr:hypothetical protein [Candidatus Lokiarchaeota archaeon]